MGNKIKTTSTAIDNRLAVTDQATGVSSSGTANSVSVTTTDLNAIGKAFDFATNNTNQANTTAKEALGVAQGTFSATTKALSDIYGENAKSLASAYSEAKGGAELVQRLAIGAMITMAAIAYFYFGKGKKNANL